MFPPWNLATKNRKIKREGSPLIVAVLLGIRKNEQ